MLHFNPLALQNQVYRFTPLYLKQTNNQATNDNNKKNTSSKFSYFFYTYNVTLTLNPKIYKVLRLLYMYIIQFSGKSFSLKSSLSNISPSLFIIKHGREWIYLNIYRAQVVSFKIYVQKCLHH